MTEAIVVYRAYQERVYLSAAGYGRIREVVGACRWLYNRSLEQRRNTYRACGKGMSKFAQMKHLTVLRSTQQWWGELDLQVARGVLVRADRAFQAFFRRIRNGETPGYPRFQGAGRFQCLELAEARTGMVKGNNIRIKGLPRMRIRPNRELPDSQQLKSLRFVMRGRHLWADMVYAEEVTPLPRNDHVVGIDSGVNERITLSSGDRIAKRVINRDKERVLQRAISRRKKGSAGRGKAVAAFAREKRRNQVRNRNECHVVTTELVRRYGTIVMEDLRISGMTRSGGARKKGLNREILTQTWGMIRSQLAYKAEWAGRKLIEVNPAYTSRTCAECGAVNPKAKVYRVFECGKCGHTDDRDVNAARNIMARGVFAPTA